MFEEIWHNTYLVSGMGTASVRTRYAHPDFSFQKWLFGGISGTHTGNAHLVHILATRYTVQLQFILAPQTHGISS